MHIDNLPKELRELALLRRKQEKNSITYASNTDIIDMFEWGLTPEDDSFWSDVNDGKNIELHNKYAKSILANSFANYEIY